MADRCIYINPSDGVLRAIAARMRAEDVIESEATGYSEPFAALVSSRDASSFCMAAASADDAGEILGVGGLVTREDFNGMAIPWAILTDAGSRRKRWVVRESRRWIGQWSQSYELRNGVHAANQHGIDFVRMLGFAVADVPYHHQKTGADFLLFAMPKAKTLEVPLCASS